MEDIIGRDRAGRTIIQLALDDAALDELLSFGAEAAEMATMSPMLSCLSQGAG